MRNSNPSDKFALYQRFNRREDMEDVVDTLRANGIPVRVSDEKDGTGEWTEQTIVGAPLRPQFWIEIPAGMFEKANFMLQEAAEADLDEEDIDAHPFNDYSVRELQQVLVEESDWSPEAVVIARRLLLRRGKNVDLKQLRDEARARLAEEYRPLRGNQLLLIGLGLVSVVVGLMVWILGIMITLGLLLYYAFGTRRDPKGSRHNTYDEITRRQSRVILGILALATVAGLVNYFYLGWFVFPDIDGWLWWWR